MDDFVQRTLKVKIEFIEPILGSTPKNEDIYTKYIGSHAPDAKSLKEEVESLGVSQVIDDLTTGFLIDYEGNPLIANYTIKGFFKNAAKSLRRIPGKVNLSSKMAAYKEKINTLIFIYPRMIQLIPPDGKSVEDVMRLNQRSLRAETPKGERIALASSEELPEGTTAEFEVQLLDKTHEDVVREWLDYGRFYGLGQWRNADYGRFEWMEIK